MRLVLGSGSPRRLELLGQLGLTPEEIRTPDVDETPLRGELPRKYCERVTRAKLDAVAAGPDDVVLCADTTVALGRRILGKPAGRTEAERFLRLLSGRRHRVITSVAVKNATRSWQKTVETAVRMKPLGEDELQRYLDTDDWRGKAGAYAIQGPAGAFIPWIQGSYTAVMGLPVAEADGLLTAAGLREGR